MGWPSDHHVVFEILGPRTASVYLRSRDKYWQSDNSHSRDGNFRHGGIDWIA